MTLTQMVREFTPGPWRVEHDGGSHHILAEQGPITVSPARAHSAADAKLIAAAPEMFEALMQLAFFNGKPASTADMERLGALFANARAILAKVQP